MWDDLGSKNSGAGVPACATPDAVSIVYPDRYRARLDTRPPAQYKIRKLLQEHCVIPLGDPASPAAQLGLEWLAHTFFYNPPTHVDVAAVLDQLAGKQIAQLFIL